MKLEIPASASERLALRKLWTRCFGAPLPRWEQWAQRVGHENLRRLGPKTQPVGGIAVYPLGQWWGGRAVPMAGIAAVAVAPEARRQGLGRKIVGEALREQRAAGVPLSALFASTEALYRSLGYEQAGTRTSYAAELSALRVQEPLRSSSTDLSLEAFEPSRSGPWRELYQRFAQTQNGLLERSEAIWARVASAGEEQQAYGTLVSGAEGAEGYVILTTRSASGGYDLRLEDFVALTPGALARLWTFCADHGTMGRTLRWSGPSHDWRQALWAEPAARVEGAESLFLRILDPRAALEARGYPAGLESSLSLRVLEDSLFPENTAPLRLEVEAGAGSCSPHSGPVDLELTIGGLAGLYSGRFSPQVLASLGWLRGSKAALARAAQLFAGPDPWLLDHF